jgi:hypothetical protein
VSPPGGERLRLGSNDITWEQFEQFCLAFFNALPEVERANRYGGSGDKQDGIDIEIVFKDGSTAGAQCRQREKFGKPDFDKAVRDNLYATDRHIVVTSGPATAPARKAAREMPDWVLWDIDDIGVRVRSLPRVDACWLLEDHLGSQQRRTFLGPAGPLTLAHWSVRFRRLLQSDRLFSHTLPLVGRDAALSALGEFISDPGEQIAILPGRGGSGKSRLLLEVARCFETAESPILFAQEGSLLSVESLEAELPAGPAVLVLDDAQRRGDAEAVIGFVESRPQLKLVLATRPHRLDEFSAAAISAGFDPDELCVIEALEPLGRDASRELARSAMDAAAGPIVDALGDATRDCQLITVLAARLLAKNAIPLGLLGNQQELREVVLARFRDELIGLVPDMVPRDKLRALLPLVAGLQPVRDGQHELFARVGAQLDAEKHDVVAWLDELERAGLLLRAGGLRRITPDVLGDYLLENECVDYGGTPTGYADRLWDTFASLAALQVLSNLSELDWRVRAEEGASALLDRIWVGLRNAYENGDAYARFRVVATIAPVAIMQPERTLDLAEIEIREPANTSVDPTFGATWSTADVRRKLAPLVRDAGLHPRHTHRAMRLLWQLGCDDQRPQPQSIDHALRLLGELGSYERMQMLWTTLVDLVEELLRNPDGHDPAAIGLLRPLMAREIMSSHSSGRRTVALQGHFIDRARTRKTRERVIALLHNATLAGGERAVAAVSVIGDALHVPHGYFNEKAPKDAVDQWRPEQRQLLNGLAEALASNPEPSVAGQIRGILRTEQERSPWPASRKRARDILARYPASLDDELVDAIERPWAGDIRGKRRQRVAERLAREYPDAEAAARALNRALAETRASDANPGPLLADLALGDARLAARILERAVGYPEERLTAYVGALLSSRSPELTSSLWESSEPVLRRLAARAYANDPNDLGEHDQHRLREMLADPDDEVRGNATLAITRLGQIDPVVAVELAAAASPRSCGEIDYLLHGINVEHASDEQLAVFLGWLEAAEQLSWEAGEFIKQAAPRNSQRVIQMLIARAREGRGVVETNQFDGLLDNLDEVSYRQALVAVRAAALDPEIAWRLAYLIKPIARGDYSVVVDVLAEWLVDPDEQKVKATCSLLHDVPSRVVFDQHEKLAEALNRAVAHPHADRVRAALVAAATSGITSRTPGQPARDDEIRVERANGIAAALPAGTAGQRFFVDLERYFREKIEADLREDEEEDLFGQ